MLGLEDLHKLNAVAEATELLNPFRPNLNVGFHKRLAYAYVFAAHTPEDSEVKASYRALARQTAIQFEHMLAGGLVVDFIDTDAYSSADEMLADLDRSHLYTFTGGTLPSDHPMTLDLGGIKLNDMFRAVHDFNGHYGGKGETHYPFGTVAWRNGGDGLLNEERAYQRHKRMYTRDAWLALTCETRAQTACNNLLEVAGGFVEQKAARLPDWSFE